MIDGKYYNPYASDDEIKSYNQKVFEKYQRIFESIFKVPLIDYWDDLGGLQITPFCSHIYLMALNSHKRESIIELITRIYGVTASKHFKSLISEWEECPVEE